MSDNLDSLFDLDVARVKTFENSDHSFLLIYLITLRIDVFMFVFMCMCD